MQGLVLNDKKSSIVADKNYIGSRIERLLFTKSGDVLGYPDYGSLIDDFFHEPEDETTAEDLINEITFLFQSYEPDLEIEDISIEILGTDSGQNGIIINMNIYVIETNTLEEISIFKIYES